jgi:hypothetical protein
VSFGSLLLLRHIALNRFDCGGKEFVHGFSDIDNPVRLLRTRMSNGTLREATFGNPHKNCGLLSERSQRFLLYDFHLGL